MADKQGWAGLFDAAFRKSRNAMVLVDEERRVVDLNPAWTRLLGYKRSAHLGRPLWEFVAGGPLLTPEEWAAQITQPEFTGEATARTTDGGLVKVQWGATVEVVTGRRLILVVALNTSRWGDRFRRTTAAGPRVGTLSEREREIVRLVALGATGPEIADELTIAHDTVRTHVRNAMEKLGARSRAHLVAKAMGDGHALR